MSSDILLQKLQELSQKTIEVYVPSLKKTAQFRPLNIKQQKDVIKASLDKNIPGVSFNQILNSIILQNSVDQTLIPLVSDRPSIAIALRKDIFGSKIKNAIKSVDLVEESGEYEIDSIVNLNLPLNFDSKKTITVGSLNVGIKIPTLAEDNKVNKEIQKNLSHLVEKENTLKEVIGELFVYEIAKFVDFIEIVGVERVNFNDLTVSTQIKLLENLTADVNKQIMDYIEEVRVFEKKYLSFNHNNTEYIINLDAAFFNNE